MLIKDIIVEDFSNFKKPSMYIICPFCSMKCGKENCQNAAVLEQKNIDMSIGEIIRLYISNPITSSIVLGGLEPIDSWPDLQFLITMLRDYTDDDIVIYSGYTEKELKEKIEWLKNFSNIIIKVGRYVPNSKSFYSNILGVELASDNQYAIKINDLETGKKYMKDKKLKISITSNKVERDIVIKALQDNDGYCPCQLEKNKDTKCLCKAFRELDEPGFCHCGLYYKDYIE